MSQFDAAIISLRDYAMSYSAAIIPGALDSVTAAIRILEAAGKVDKDKALKVIGKSDDYWDKGDETIFATIVDLLEALPETPGE